MHRESRGFTHQCRGLSYISCSGPATYSVQRIIWSRSRKIYIFVFTFTIKNFPSSIVYTASVSFACHFWKNWINTLHKLTWILIELMFFSCLFSPYFLLLTIDLYSSFNCYKKDICMILIFLCSWDFNVYLVTWSLYY